MAEGFSEGNPLENKGLTYTSLDCFCKTHGTPKFLVTDNASEETCGEWEQIVKTYLIPMKMTEPYSSWQNQCEDKIREVKKHLACITALY